MGKHIIILGSDDAPDLESIINHVQIINKTLDLMPMTCRLLAAWSSPITKGRPNLGCAACKLIDNIENPEMSQWVMPDEFDDSLEAALMHFAHMGSDAPTYIQNLFEFKDKALQRQAFTELGACKPGEDKEREWRIFQGLTFLMTLKCANPDHEMTMLASGGIAPTSTLM